MSTNWNSSYEENNYGELFYSLIRIYKPSIVVELGTLTGYSSYYIAKGLRENGSGRLDCYDLWEKYDPNRSYGFFGATKAMAEENLREFKDIITLNQAEAIGVEKEYEKVDILHIDLHNEGGILDETIPIWIDKVGQIIIVEGGSIERDEIDPIGTYKRKPMYRWLKDFKDKKGIEYFTFTPFPSLTIIRKK